jgi:hypothetical protein
MKEELERMDLTTIRNLFLQEARHFLIAVDLETREELEQRREKIKLIEEVLEEKKKEFYENYRSKYSIQVFQKKEN